MARWKLTEPHYLTVPGTEWEYNEVDRITGRPKRTKFQVPMYVNPNSGDDVLAWGQGEIKEDIIVCYAGSEQNGKDIVFKGDPTPGMKPLDDEAKEISARWEKKWNHQVTQGIDPESQNQSYTNSLLSGLIDQMTEARSSAQTAPAAPGMDKMLEGMMALMEKQTEILAGIAAQSAPRTIRR